MHDTEQAAGSHYSCLAPYDLCPSLPTALIEATAASRPTQTGLLQGSAHRVMSERSHLCRHASWWAFARLPLIPKLLWRLSNFSDWRNSSDCQKISKNMQQNNNNKESWQDFSTRLLAQHHILPGPYHLTEGGSSHTSHFFSKTILCRLNWRNMKEQWLELACCSWS